MTWISFKNNSIFFKWIAYEKYFISFWCLLGHIKSKIPWEWLIQLAWGKNQQSYFLNLRKISKREIICITRNAMTLNWLKKLNNTNQFVFSDLFLCLNGKENDKFYSALNFRSFPLPIKNEVTPKSCS